MTNDQKLSREVIEEIVKWSTWPCDAEVTIESLAEALLKAWDALKGLDKFDDNNRIEPYCVVCKLATSRGHAPDCKLEKALPRQDGE